MKSNFLDAFIQQFLKQIFNFNIITYNFIYFNHKKSNFHLPNQSENYSGMIFLRCN